MNHGRTSTAAAIYRGGRPSAHVNRLIDFENWFAELKRLAPRGLGIMSISPGRRLGVFEITDSQDTTGEHVRDRIRLKSRLKVDLGGT